MNARAELGTDAELIALVDKIKGFKHDDASPAENLALAQALKIVAQDIVLRHDEVREMQAQLAHKIAIAEVAGELAGVVSTLRPVTRKRGWFFRK